jgi:hypothetical protein
VVVESSDHLAPSLKELVGVLDEQDVRPGPLSEFHDMQESLKLVTRTQVHAEQDEG